MADRINERWERLRRERRKAVVPYITPEYPVAGCTTDLVLALCDAGADFVEIGIPFSDPLADGPVIQTASQIALKNGATPASVLRTVSEIRRKTDTPMILMGYANPILRAGVDAYFRSAKQSGVDGCIIPDLPPEEAGAFRSAARDHGIGLTFLIAPTSTDVRIRMVDDASTHFSYCVSIKGVTGNQKGFASGGATTAFLSRVRSLTKKPFVVGFGISTRQDVERVSAIADGAVVGTALLEAISAFRSNTDIRTAAVRLFRTLQG